MHVRIAKVNGRYRVWLEMPHGPAEVRTCDDEHDAAVYANQLSDMFGPCEINTGATPKYPVPPTHV